MKRNIVHLCLTGLLMLAGFAQAAEPIKLGLNYPSTGRYKEQGLAQARGALLAVEEINASGGILKRPVELLTANSASKPDKAVDNVKELAAQGVSMLFGGSSSAVAIAAGQEAAKHNLLYFGTLTYANETTGAQGHKYMFRETYNAHMAAKALAAYLNESLKDKKLFYITADYSWGWSTEDSLRAFTNTEDKGVHPGVLTAYPRPRDSDFKDALQQAEASGADVLMLVQFGDDMAMALKVAQQMGLKDKMTIIVPNLTLGMARSAGSGIMEGVIGADHQNVQSVYVVRSRPRNDVLKSDLHEDFFEILLQLPGEQAVQTAEEWALERKSVGKSLALE